MYAYTHDGRLIENARILAAGPGNGGMAFMIEGDLGGGGTFREWIAEIDLRVIRFDRATMFDPVPEPGPDDFKIGTRHEAAQAAMAQVMSELDGKSIE